MNNQLEKIFNLKTQCENRISLWTDVINKNKLSNIAEVGVWKGDFAQALLKECPAIRHYTMIDPWANLNDWNKPFNVDNSAFAAVYDEAIEKTAFAKDKITVLRNTTIEACKQLENDSLDMVYIDGDHTLRGITLDLLSIYNKVRDGGIIAGDDFTLSPWQHDERFEPTLIFPFAVYFAEAMQIPIISFGSDQFAMLKDKNIGYQFIDLTESYSEPNLNSLR